MTDTPERITAWVNADGSTQFEAGELFPKGVEVEYVRADLARARPKVKPLVWDWVMGEYVETKQAECPLGFYRVFVDEDSAAGALFVEFATSEDFFCSAKAVRVAHIYGEFHEAEVAAQADYERRIMGACYD